MTEQSRRVLPTRRPNETFALRFWGDKFHVTVGYYPDDKQTGEIFIAGSKRGQDMDSICHDAAILFSLARQYGCPLQIIKDALGRNADETPATLFGAIADRLTEMEKEESK